MPPVHSIKFVFMGNCGVGKSSLFSRLINNTFPQTNDSTLGAAYMEVFIYEYENKRLEFHKCMGDIRHHLAERIWRVCVWDTAGQERYRSLLPMYYRGAQVVAIVHDNTPESITRAKESLGEMEMLWEKTGLVLSICQNKSDLPGAEVNVELANDSRVVHWAHVSAATGDGVQEFFVEACRPYIVFKGSSADTVSDVLLDPTISLEEPTRRYNCCK